MPVRCLRQLTSAGPFQRVPAGYADIGVVCRMTLHDRAAEVVEDEFASRCLDDQNRMALPHSCPHDSDTKSRGRDACTDQALALGHDIIVAIALLDVDRPDVALLPRRFDLAVHRVVDPANGSFNLSRVGHDLGLRRLAILGVLQAEKLHLKRCVGASAVKIQLPREAADLES